MKRYKRFRKRSGFKRKRLWNQLKNVKKRIKKVEKSIEKKMHIYSGVLSSQYYGAMVMTCIGPAIPTGTDQNCRLGNKINVHKIILKITAAPNTMTNGTILRFIFVRFKTYDPTGPPAWGDLFITQTPLTLFTRLHSQYNTDGQHLPNCRILWDKVYTMNNTCNWKDFMKTFTWKKANPTGYYSSTLNHYNEGVYGLFIVNSELTDEFTVEAKFIYSDA